MRFWRQEVYRIHVRVRRPLILDLLDIYNASASPNVCNVSQIAPTRNILIENVIFFNHIVKDSLAVGVHHQNLPLGRISSALSSWRPRLTSPRVMFFMAPTITEAEY